MPDNKAEIIIAAKNLAGKALNDVVRDTKGMASRSAVHVKKLASVFTNTLGGAIKRAGQMLTSLKTLALTALAGWGLSRLAKGFLDTGMQTEQYRVVLETLLKSTEKAKEYFAWIEKFASKTPFQIPVLVEAATRLKAYSLDAKKYLRTLGDTASAMSKPLMAAVEAVADASQGEYERLKEFGLRAADIAKKAGFESVQAMNSTRENLQKGIETLMLMFDEKFKGGMEKASKTLAGIWSNLGDHWTSFKTMVMDSGVMTVMENFLGNILTKINQWAESGKLKAWAEATGSAIEEWFSKAEIKFWKFWNELESGKYDKWIDDTKKAFKTAYDTIKKWVDDVSKTLKPLWKALETTVGWITTAIDYWKNFAKDFKANQFARDETTGAAKIADISGDIATPIEIPFSFTGTGSATLPLSEKIAEMQDKLNSFAAGVSNLRPTFNIDTSQASSSLTDLYTDQLRKAVEAATLLGTVSRERGWYSGKFKEIYAGQMRGAEAGLAYLEKYISSAGGSSGTLQSTSFSGDIIVNVSGSQGARTADDWRSIVRNYIIPELRSAGY